MTPQPAIGRIVRVVLFNAQGALITRPGIVVNKDADRDLLTAQIFTDGCGEKAVGDGLPSVLWKSGLAHDATGKQHHTWHWPSRE